jgi:hypothetical protein
MATMEKVTYNASETSQLADTTETILLSHQERRKIAKIGYVWGSCRTVGEKERLFQHNPEYHELYIDIEFGDLVSLLHGFEDKNARIALGVMDMEHRAWVLNLTALNYGGERALRLLNFLSHRDAIAALLHVQNPGAISITLNALTPESREVVTWEMTNQLIPWKERIFKAPKGDNIIPITEDFLKTLRDELQECSEPGCPFKVFKVKDGWAINIKGCLKHAYHLACGSSHENICTEAAQLNDIMDM